MARLQCTLVVEGSGGEPLARVKFAVEKASEPVPEMAYMTGPDGRASVGLPPGDVSVRFFLPDGSAQTADLRIEPASGREYVVRLATGKKSR